MHVVNVAPMALAISVAVAAVLPAAAYAASFTSDAEHATGPSVSTTNGSSKSQQTPTPQAERRKRKSTPTKKTPETLQGMTVLGSLIPRTQLEGAKPVAVFTGQQIKEQGFTNLSEFMDSLPQAGVAEPSFSWGATSVNARQLNLRNMGPQFSLLMIDGHRVVDYPQPGDGKTNFQNYNNIPIGMVERVEILGAGASSIYGSEAVAGIVNVILRKHYQGDELQVTGGAATRGGLKYDDFNWIGGRSGDKWHVVYNFEHSNRQALWGGQRGVGSYADSGYGTYNQSERLFGFLNPAEVYLKDASGKYIDPPPGACRSIPTMRRQYDLTAATSGSNVLPGLTNHGSYCTQDVFDKWILSPGSINNSIYIAGSYDLTSNVQAYGSVAVYSTTGISNTSLPFLFAFDVPPKFYNVGTNQLITAYFRRLTAPEIGTQANTYDIERNWNINTGLKGTVFSDIFDWALNFNSQKYLVHEDYTGINEQGMFNFFFGPQLGTTNISGVTYPIFDVNQSRFFGPISPQDYRTFGVSGVNNAWSWMDGVSLNVNSVDLFDIPWDGKPIGWAGVVEAYLNGYKLEPDPRGVSGTFANPFLADNTGGGTRHRYSAATELRIPLLSTLDVDLSGRLDKYADASIADVARTWGVGIEWRPVKSLLVRGSYGTNFKAPDMQAIYQTGSVVPEGIYADPYQCIQIHDVSCQPFSHSTFFNLYTGGSRNLLPQEGSGWTAGLVWDPPWINGLSMSADYWRTGVDNAIEYISFGTALTDDAGCLTGLQVSGARYTAHPQGSPYCQLIISDVARDAAGNITEMHVGPINEASLYVSGIDASLNYHVGNERFGAFVLSLNYTDNLTFKEKVLANSPVINTRYQNVASKVTWTAAWHRNHWAASLSGLRYGSLRSPNFGGCVTLDNGIHPTIGDSYCTPYYGMTAPWIIWNGSVSDQLTKRIGLMLTVHNIFDKLAPIEFYSSSFPFTNWQQGSNLDGREVFLKLTYKID